jgi:DNA repair protein RadC
MSLKDLPAEMRPREMLLARGGAALSDVELLALLLRTGLPGKGVFDLAGQVLKEFKGFAGLLQAEAADLKRIKGLGPAKRAEIAAVVEMARRALAQPLREEPVFSAPQQVKDYVALQLGTRAQEVFVVLFLDGQHRLLLLEEMIQGTLTQTSVYPREVVRRALELRAGAVILAHNRVGRSGAEPCRRVPDAEAEAEKPSLAFALE